MLILGPAFLATNPDASPSSCCLCCSTRDSKPQFDAFLSSSRLQSDTSRGLCLGYAAADGLHALARL